jgi:peptidyl-prolyl cis-trans isomerase D
MFDFIRNNRRFLQFVLMVMILPSFVFFGIQGYNRIGDGDQLASIGQQNVTQTEVDNGMRDQLERVKQQFGGQVDTKMFDTPEARQAMLDRLINQKVVAAQAQQSNLSGSDAKLRELLVTVPGVFQDGKVDMEAYKRFASSQGQGLSIEGFEARLRSDIATQQVTSALAASALTQASLANKVAQELTRARTVQALTLSPQSYIASAKADPAAVKSFYESNKKQFELAERAKIEYVVFDTASVAQNIAVSAADIQSYYDQNKNRFGTPEERRAAHILVKLDKSASSADVDAAKAKAAVLEAKVRKDPASFAKVAAANSDDPGSQEKGGDLGFIKVTTNFVKPFLDAAFALKVKEISTPVRSEFGFHIITINEIKPANIKPLAEVSKELEQEIKNQQAAKKFAEQTELFSNGVYEQGDSFKGVAEKFKLTVKTADGMTRDAMKAPKQVPADLVFNEKLAAAVFSEDSIKGRKNTEAVEIVKGRLVSARLVDYTPAKTLPFDEVKATVEGQVVQAEMVKLAKLDGEAKLKALQTNPAGDAPGLEATAKQISRSKTENLPPAALKAILKADTSKLPVWVGAELPNGQYGLYKVTAVAADVKVEEAQLKQAEAAVRRAYSDAELQGAVAAMRERLGVKVIKKPAAADAVKL